MKGHWDWFFKLAQQGIYNERKRTFYALGTGGQYNDRQKNYAFTMIAEYGVRATSRILCLPRRTLQRWIKENNIYVKRCPEWVYDWVYKRRKKREFWERRGYF